jgi:mannose-6-phosphate isomerase-like protein (cupin superfamily)
VTPVVVPVSVIAFGSLKPLRPCYPGILRRMAAYTHRNLQSDVEDSAQKFGMGDVLEAHFARNDLEATQFGLSLQRLKPGARMPFGHRHAQQEEVYVVVDGSGRLKVEDEVLEVGPWDAVRVSPEAARAFEAGDDGLTLIAFGAPNTGMGDAEQLPGWWD